MKYGDYDLSGLVKAEFGMRVSELVLRIVFYAS